MNGVSFGEKHSYNDFGLILSAKTIGIPTPQTNRITVPLRDGYIDLAEKLIDDVKYKERKITLTFSVNDPVNLWHSKMSKIENYLHGQTMKIVFDDDSAFYYIGQVSVNKFTSKKNIGTIVIECVVDPYKYDILSSIDDWIWDTFDFEDGYINETADVVVDGNTEITIIGRRKKICPVIITSAAMELTFEGNTYSLKEGKQKAYGVLLHEGENVLSFSGNGSVTIDYRGGSL